MSAARAGVLATGPMCSAQRGAALIVSLVVLILVTLVALAGAQRAMVDEKAARSGRDREVATQAAEAALRDAMADIETGPRAQLFSDAPQGFDDGCANVSLPADAASTAASRRGLCLARDATEARQAWQDVSLAQRGVPFGTFTQRPWDATQAPAPSYLIESVPLARAGYQVQSTQGDAEQLAFRITAVGFGPPGSNVEVALQSYFVKIR